MLVADLNGTPTEAADATRGANYRCPGCKGALVLKQGRIVIHHFAHKPPVTCNWVSSESRAHLEAKKLLQDALRERGLRANAEFVVDTLTGDRRADVMTWRSDGQMVAFELQHTSVSLVEIERRAFSYAHIGVAQIWIPFLRQDIWKNAERIADGFFIPRYSPRPFEKWVHGLNHKNGMWMYDPPQKALWRAHLSPHELYVPESSWYVEGGEKMSGGGYYRSSKRFRDLTMRGPFIINQLRIKLITRQEATLENYKWPAGKIAYFVPTES